ncbi:MAG: HEPN domain-containing protein [Pseudohongiellaceae bacterium]
MAYHSHFSRTDDLIEHLNKVVPPVENPLLQLQYVGFVSVTAVAVYELAIKTIFVDFSKQKHHIFGNFVESYFDRLNGRIRVQDIVDDKITKFGKKYVDRFQEKLKKREADFRKENKRDCKSAYENIIHCRNHFAHGNLSGVNGTYQEVVQAYRDGKEVIHTLDETMRL